MPAVIASTTGGAIGAQGNDLPGVNDEARLAARFAAEWAERRKIGALPVEGHRIYEARAVAAREVWLWADHGFRSIAAAEAPAHAEVRVCLVYTPPEYRRSGYAEALVCPDASAAPRGSPPDAIRRPRQPHTQRHLPPDRL
jgi:hypothetical protein